MKKHRSPNTVHQTLSVVLATRNEEENIGSCLESVRGIADEIVIFDEESTDRTREIAKKYGAKVFTAKHEEIFHKTKQKALDKATGDWILQLDADERVTDELALEIREIINLSNEELTKRIVGHPERVERVEGSQRKGVSKVSRVPRVSKAKKVRLFQRHETLVRQREGKLGRSSGEVVAFFVPRVNYFLGKPLRHAGVYPDGVIRLVKKGKARFPCKSVHELMEIDGEVAWLFADLEHHDSPTLSRYLKRANRYTDLTAQEFKEKRLSVNYWNLFKYSCLVPSAYFLKLYIRHKGFLDGMRGFIWSFFSALHYPLAYFKYWTLEKNRYNTET